MNIQSLSGISFGEWIISISEIYPPPKRANLARGGSG